MMYKPFEWVMPASIYYNFEIGLWLGYLYFETWHHLLHGATFKEGSHFDNMKKYHFLHHYKYPLMLMQTTFKLWDKILKTDEVSAKQSYEKSETKLMKQR